MTNQPKPSIFSSLCRIGLLSSFIVSGAGHAQQTLNILNWDDYLSQGVISQWEMQTGNKIHIITYDDEQARDVLLTTASPNQIDLAIVDKQSAKKQAKLGYLSDLTNFSVVGGADQRWRDMCGDHAYPYLWGTYGIAYRKDKVKPVLSWAELFSSRQDLVGHIGMLSDYYGLTAPALITLNLSPSTDNKADLQKAFELLKKQTKDVLTYEYAPTYVLSDKNKDLLYVAPVYSGDQYTMNNAMGKEVWQYVEPKEGAFLWLDCWVVPVQSKKRALAESFLKFLAQPEIAAKNSEELGVASTSTSAYNLQSEAFRSDQSVYVPKEAFDKLMPFETLSDGNVRQRIRIEEAIKVIHESQ